MLVMDKEGKIFDEERALYGSHGVRAVDCRFDGPNDGESAFKESRDIIAENCFFNLRYPFWHTHTLTVEGCEMTSGSIGFQVSPSRGWGRKWGFRGQLRQGDPYEAQSDAPNHYLNQSARNHKSCDIHLL